MTLLGNAIWLIFGGFLSAMGHILAGAAMCLTIIGIPFGLQEFKIGIATLTPFGMELVEYDDANSPLRLVLNVIWLVVFGWIIALIHLFWAVALAITVIGIPFALQHLKLIPLALFPFGRDLVPIGSYDHEFSSHEGAWRRATGHP